MFLARADVSGAVVVHVASREELPVEYADELRGIVRREMADEEIEVLIVAVRGWWRSDKNGDPGK